MLLTTPVVVEASPELSVVFGFGSGMEMSASLSDFRLSPEHESAEAVVVVKNVLAAPQ